MATVTIAPQGGKSSQSVAYGAIVSGFTAARGGNNLNEATAHGVNSGHESGLRQTSNPVNLTIGGGAAKSVERLGPSVQGKGGVVLYMVLVAPDPDFDTLRQTFDRFMRSLTVR